MTKKILGFDGIRGLAAIMVVLTHLGFWKFLSDHNLLIPSIIPMIHGQTGVQAFFILSGFLITALLIAEKESTGTIAIKHFFIRRALRIFPLYILFLIIATIIYLIDTKVITKESLLFAYGYIYNFVPKSLYTPFLGHTWSLAVEEHFYLIWPFIFAYTFQKRRTLLLAFLFACLASPPFLHFWLVRMGLSKTYFVERWTFIAGYSIGVGCMLAIVMLSGASKLAIQHHLGKYSSLIFSGFLYVFPATMHGLSLAFDNILSGYVRCVGIAGIIGWLYLNQKSAAVKCLEFKPLKYLGTISYGIYMYQGLFLATGSTRHIGHFWPPPSQLTGFFWVVILAPLSYHLFEKPFIRLKHKFKSSTVERVNKVTIQTPDIPYL